MVFQSVSVLSKDSPEKTSCVMSFVHMRFGVFFFYAQVPIERRFSEAGDSTRFSLQRKPPLSIDLLHLHYIAAHDRPQDEHCDRDIQRACGLRATCGEIS
jgi:hypothetical protein